MSFERGSRQTEGNHCTTQQFESQPHSGILPNSLCRRARGLATAKLCEARLGERQFGYVELKNAVAV
jgi:hypothetical protein